MDRSYGVRAMTHHKRGRPKNRRGGCLLCKPHKANGVNVAGVQERRALIGEREQVRAALTRLPTPRELEDE